MSKRTSLIDEHRPAKNPIELYRLGVAALDHALGPVESPRFLRLLDLPPRTALIHCIRASRPSSDKLNAVSFLSSSSDPLNAAAIQKLNAEIAKSRLQHPEIPKIDPKKVRGTRLRLPEANSTAPSFSPGQARKATFSKPYLSYRAAYSWSVSGYMKV